MKLYSQDGQAHLRIEPVGVFPPTGPRLPVEVEVAGYGFAGQDAGIWVSRAELDAFLRALQSLASSRRGGAQLTSVGHGEFGLELRCLESSSRVLAAVRIEALKDEGGQPHRYSASLEFEVDPVALPSWVEAFRALRAYLGDPGA